MEMGDNIFPGDPPDSISKNGSGGGLYDDPENQKEYFEKISSQKNIQAGPVVKAKLNPSQTQTNAGDKPEENQKEGCFTKCLKELIKKIGPGLGTRVNLKTGCKIFVGLSLIWIACCIIIPPETTASILQFLHLPVPFPVLWFWLLTMTVFVADGIAIGYFFKERWSGIFINERNLMSLSRVQVGLWSLLILSAFFTILVARWRSGVPDPMNIGIDLQVWALMGISLGSLAGRTAIMGKKGVTKQDETKVATILNKQAKNVAIQLNITEDEAKSKIKDLAKGDASVLYSHDSPQDAGLMDMFQGDEVVNKWVVDIGKVQLLFFTVITVAAYASAIGAMLLTTAIGSITALPPMTDGFVAIVGVSHAGLLGNSATIQTPTKQ